MQIEIPTFDGAKVIEAEPGKPVILLGPNGSGKSRLGIYIDDLDATGASHRIAAQRSLEMPQEVFSEDFDQAIGSLRRDKSDKKRKKLSPGTMQYAYEELLATLFAERNRALTGAHAASSGKAKSKRPTTLIDQLQALWSELIPHQRLFFSERSVRAVSQHRDAEPFDGSEMSDGERLIVYMLGQALLLDEDGLLIVDEPELHMSRVLLVRLWDVVERACPKCSFIYITHDVDFAASRRNAKMYAVLDYRPPTIKEVMYRGRKRLVEDIPSRWKLEALPPDADVPGEVLVRIVGSRKPILFVEGRTGGLDHLVYKAVYRNFTIIPVETCRQVVQLIRSFAMQGSLHWLHCAGLVDKDQRTVEPDGRLEEGLYALPVNEIENLLLVEDVFLALATSLSFPNDEARRRLARLKAKVLDLARRDSDRMSLKRTSARIWEASGSMGVKAKSIAELTRLYNEMVARTSPEAIYKAFREEYGRLVEIGDYQEILKIYDNKGGLLDLLAKSLDLGGSTELVSFLSRIIVQEEGSALVDALGGLLPPILAKA